MWKTIYYIYIVLVLLKEHFAQSLETMLDQVDIKSFCWQAVMVSGKVKLFYV